VAHKLCGLLSEFSTVAGDLAGTIEDCAAGSQLGGAAPILEQLETLVLKLLQQVDEISIESLRRFTNAGDN
jgi:hypothetical protein